MGSREDFDAILQAPPVPLLDETAQTNPQALLATLEEIGAEIEKARNNGSAKGAPRKQHVVSQCVLRNFTDKTRDGVKLVGIDLKNISRVNYSPLFYATKGSGRIDDYVTYDSQGAEQLWGLVEDLLPGALRTISTGLPDKAAEQVLRGAVALHWVRRLSTRDFSESAFAEAIAEMRRPETRDRLIETMRDAVGGSNEDLEDQAEVGLQFLEGLNADGVMFRGSVERVFRLAVQAAQLGRFHLLEAPSGASFLISDNPVVTYDLKDQYAPQSALFDLTEMAMPVSPRHLIQIVKDGQGDGAVLRLLEPDEVDEWNRLQVRQARSFIIHHPSSDYLSFVREHMPVDVRDQG